MQHMGGIYKFLTDGNKDLSSAIGVALLGLAFGITLPSLLEDSIWSNANLDLDRKVST